MSNLNKSCSCGILLSTDNTYPSKTWICKSCAKKQANNYYSNNKEYVKNRRNTLYNLSEEAKVLFLLKEQQEKILKLKSKEYKRFVQRLNRKNKYHSNPLFKLAVNLRTRMNNKLKAKSWSKDSEMSKYLGCSLEQLKQHLEAQFKPGMSWNNWSVDGWHIDHIVPLASARSKEELYELCHYTNLQPLWALENWIKADYNTIKPDKDNKDGQS